MILDRIKQGRGFPCLYRVRFAMQGPTRLVLVWLSHYHVFSVTLELTRPGLAFRILYVVKDVTLEHTKLALESLPQLNVISVMLVHTKQDRVSPYQ